MGGTGSATSSDSSSLLAALDGSGSDASTDPLSMLSSLGSSGSATSTDPLSFLTSLNGSSSGLSPDSLAMLTAASLPGLSTADQLSSALPASALTAMTASLGSAAAGGPAASQVGSVAVGAAAVGATTGATSTTDLSGPYAGLFTAAGTRYGVDPALLSAVAKTESDYNPTAVSPAGARGLMQLMPGTARSLGVNPNDPTQAVDGAARMLSGLLKQFGGNVDLAVAGYNAGAGAVARYGGVPPYAETRSYVQKVTSNWETLR
jgi:soluble lytic murein transglycosylase-like protein